MRLLLDTHVALWAITDDGRLPEMARQLVLEPSNEIFVSAATIWEISIKHALARRGPTAMPISGGQALIYFKAAGYGLLSISSEHAAAAGALPPIHNDPFDRMLVAQALLEPFRLVTRDAQVQAYSDTVIRI